MEHRQEDQCSQAFTPAPEKVEAAQTLLTDESFNPEWPCEEGFKLTPGNIPGRGYNPLDDVSSGK